MSKRNFEMEDSELRDLEERYVEMMKEMEKDKQTQSFQIPEEWDKKFQQTIDETLKEQWKKRRMRRVKNVGVAAAVLLAVTFGVDRGLVAVHGDGLMEVVQSVLNENDKNYTILGEDNDVVLSTDADVEIYYEATTVKEACEKIHQDILRPMFYIPYIPEGYELKETKYNKTYQIANFILEKENKQVYFFQQMILNEDASGSFTDEKEVTKVKNEYLDQVIEIYESNQDDSLKFMIPYGNTILSFNGRVSVDECEKIAGSIYFE